MTDHEGTPPKSLLLLALDKGIPLLRGIFEDVCKKEAVSSPPSLKGGLFKDLKLELAQKNKWENLEEWDITLFVAVLLKAKWKKTTWSKAEKKALDVIRNVRNGLIHHSLEPLSLGEYTEASEKLIKAYRDLGMEGSELEGLEKAVEKGSRSVGRKMNVEATLEAHLLFLDGLEAEEKRDIETALSKYSDCISTHRTNALPSVLAACHAGRARCHFEKKDFLKAEFDVVEATLYEPWKGDWHILLGYCLKDQYKYDRAVRAFEKGIGLCKALDDEYSTDAMLKKALYECRHEFDEEKSGRATSFYYSYTDMEFRAEEELRVRRDLTRYEVEEEMKNNLPPGPSLVLAGHTCRREGKLDEAFALYHRAYTEYKDGEGAFCIGQMYSKKLFSFTQGKEYSLAMEWYNRATFCMPRVGKMLRRDKYIGLSDAHYALGLMYRSGVGVDNSDYLLAIYHFQMSSDMDHGCGCHMLGLMYMEGRPPFLDQDLSFAEDLFRKSWALSNVPEAAYHISLLLRFERNCSEYLKWLNASKQAGVAKSVIEQHKLLFDAGNIPKVFKEVFLKADPVPNRGSKVVQVHEITMLRDNPNLASSRYEKRYANLLKGIWYCKTIEEAAKEIRKGCGCFSILPQCYKDRMVPLLERSSNLRHTSDYAVVSIILKTPRDPTTISYVEALTKKFPNEAFLWARYADLMLYRMSNRDRERVLPICDKVMSLVYPSSVEYCEMLYMKAFIFEELQRVEEAVTIYEKFINHKEADGHRKYPIACFSIALCGVISRIDPCPMIQAGLVANERLDDRFKVESNHPRLEAALEILHVLRKKKENTAMEIYGGSVLEKGVRENPQNLCRERLTKVHSERINQKEKDENDLLGPKTLPTKHVVERPFLITIDDMQTKQGEGLFVNGVFRCVVISSPLKTTSWTVLVEDCHRSVMQLAIYGIRDEEEQKLEVGRVLWIKTPRTRLPASGEPLMLRVDPGVSEVVFNEKVPMCHTCCLILSKKKKKMKCGQCKTALYCSKECQKKDWKELYHKKICREKTSRVHIK